MEKGINLVKCIYNINKDFTKFTSTIIIQLKTFTHQNIFKN